MGTKSLKQLQWTAQ